jgi:glutaminyl-tRNA synthetase
MTKIDLQIPDKSFLFLFIFILNNMLIRTRFPPEPNGFMHLGHAKSAYHNFNYPHHLDSDLNEKDTDITKECYLRFDDTNPKTEKQLYVDSITKDLLWLGYKPDKITFTSDYFTKILELTQLLIVKGYAYCDPSTGEEISKQRHTKTESPYRDRPIEETIDIFTDMTMGKYKDGDMTLRLKIPIEDRTNDCMIDPIAYRIIHEPHYRTNLQFKVYPSYEYSHYIVDSLEGITHSFCTLEFYVRRNLSYWILDKLELTKPIIDESNRLEMDFGMLSKRKIKGLIDEGNIDGWDDPRLLTISGLRNRGLNPDIINGFCSKLSYTKNMNSVIYQHVFDNVIRTYLNANAPRRMAVFNPLKVNLINIGQIRIFNKPLYPNKDGCNKNVITHIGPVIYIEKEDFQKSANKKYKRMTIDKIVRIKYAGIIKYESHKEDDDGNVTELNATFIAESENTEKVNGTIHWVSYKMDKEPIIIDIINWGYDGTKNIEKVYLDDIMNEEYSEYWQLERQCYVHLRPGATTGNYLVNLKESRIAKDLKK